MKNNIIITKNVLGEEIYQYSNKLSAGAVAQAHGKIFEDAVGNILEDSLSDGYYIKNQPKYIDHYDIGDEDARYKDFLLEPYSTEDTPIMIEVKQLGDCTIVQKLDYEWNNLQAGCYGKNFWLIYDYRRENKSAIHMVHKLKIYCTKLAEKVLKDKGIKFHFIDHNDLKGFLSNEIHKN